MNIKLSLGNLSSLESEVLVVVAVNDGNKQAPQASLLASDPRSLAAASPLLSSDITGNALELTWLYAPQGVKAKRLLVIGGGKADKFDPNTLRNIAGAAVRALKPKKLKSLAIALPENAPHHFTDANWVRALAIGALVGDFDPNYYHSDRKDESVSELTIIAPLGRRQQSPPGRARRRPHHRRVAELYPRPGQRARQPDDAHHPRRTRQEDVRRGRARLRGPLAPTRSRN